MTGKISEDPDVGALAGDELIPVVSGGANRRTTPLSLATYIGGSVAGIPEGGSTGQSLVKASNDDFDVAWQTPAGSGDMLASANLSDLDDASTALGNLGGTTVGKAVFTAPDEAAAREVIDVPGLSVANAFTDTTDASSATSGALKISGGLGVSKKIYTGSAFLAPIGSASAPSYSFSSDANTGMFSGGTDTISFSAGGTLVMHGNATTFNLDIPTVAGSSFGVSGVFTSGGRALLNERVYVNFSAQTIGSGQVVIAYDSVSAVKGIRLFSNSSTGTPIDFLNNSAAIVGSISTTTTTTAFNTSSDQRLKDNFSAVLNAADIINALKIYAFDWKYAAGSRGVGVKAQEAITVVPEAVTKGDDNPSLKPAEEGFEPWGVDYSKFVPYLIAAVQELNASLGAATARIEDLEATKNSSEKP